MKFLLLIWFLGPINKNMFTSITSPFEKYMFRVSNKDNRIKHISVVSVISIVELQQVFDQWENNTEMCEPYKTCLKL